MKKYLYLSFITLVLFTACNGDDTTDPVIEEEEEQVYIPEIFTSFDCFPQFSESSIELVTWNMEFYPLDFDTPSTIRTVLDTLKADVIAFQEIKDPANLTTVIDSLPDWEFVYADVRYDLELGFAYRTTEITSISSLEILFSDDANAFPREPVMATVQHISGEEITLINIHLKCCDNGIERRKVASEKLKNYIDTNLPDSKVVLLGDFNDEIDDVDNPFSNFIMDDQNYRFTDMDIALGDPANWSYPSYGPEGSHIDHILITDEFFNYTIETTTLTLGECISRYEYNVSDHLPVMVSISL